MPDVEVVVPYQAGCEYRARALGWVLEWWARAHPEWRVTVAPAPAGPWVKARAVNPAVEASTADVVVLADADVFCQRMTDAVDALSMVPWSIPHTPVHRLTAQATTQLLAGGQVADLELEQRAYPGIPGGGLIVGRREALLDCPLDPRFVGWGQEDNSLSYALVTLHGQPWRGTAPLIHLWHPPQPRMDRKQGSPEGVALRKRYLRARWKPDLMRDLIAEGRQS